MVEATQVDPGEASVSPRRSGGHRPTDNDDDDDDNDDNDDNDDDNDDNGSFILSLCSVFHFPLDVAPAGRRPPTSVLAPSGRKVWAAPPEIMFIRRASGHRRRFLTGSQTPPAEPVDDDPDSGDSGRPGRVVFLTSPSPKILALCSKTQVSDCLIRKEELTPMILHCSR